MSAHIGEAQVSFTADSRPFTTALLSLSKALDRVMHQLSWAQPPPLAIDGHAYRRRTRRRKP